MSEKETIQLSAMPTPNPNTIKFLPNLSFFEQGTVNFPNRENKQGSVLVDALFEIEEIEGIMIGSNFISVTKHEKESWDTLIEPIRDTIKEILEEFGTKIVDESLINVEESYQSDNEEIAEKIKVILDTEIRPAVAMDGGDILFRSFKNGIVTLFMQGACSSCPASTMTLKMGVENRLKEEFSEVKEVVQEF